MALHDEILREIMAGRVPWRFKTRDLKRIPGNSRGYYRVGNSEYSENGINTIPRNHSIRVDGTDPGDYVRKGRQPAFFWLGGGEYELILNREHHLADVGSDDEEFDMAEGAEETLIRGNQRNSTRRPLPLKVDDDLVLHIAQQNMDPGAIIVRYLAEQPFQAYYRSKPVRSPVRGWGARLLAYFWPTRECSWSSTCTIVSGLSSQVQRAVERLGASPADTVAARKLMDAYKGICLWGVLGCLSLTRVALPLKFFVPFSR